MPLGVGTTDVGRLMVGLCAGQNDASAGEIMLPTLLVDFIID